MRNFKLVTDAPADKYPGPVAVCCGVIGGRRGEFALQLGSMWGSVDLQSGAAAAAHLGEQTRQGVLTCDHTLNFWPDGRDRDPLRRS